MIAILSMATTVGASAKDGDVKPTKVYAFGVSTSFNDSTVFFTEMQEIDNALIESKSHFIVGRADYAIQLRDHLSEKGYPKRTCLFVCDVNRKKAEKKYDKMKQRFVKKGRYDLLLIDRTEFSFRPITESSASQMPSIQKTKKTKGKKSGKDKSNK